MSFVHIFKTAQLKVENSAQTSFRFSPISFCAPRFKVSNLAPADTGKENKTVKSLSVEKKWILPGANPGFWIELCRRFLRWLFADRRCCVWKKKKSIVMRHLCAGLWTQLTCVPWPCTCLTPIGVQARDSGLYDNDFTLIIKIYTSMKHSLLQTLSKVLALHSLDTLSDVRIKVFTLLF